jgi:hypothetical protein
MTSIFLVSNNSVENDIRLAKYIRIEYLLSLIGGLVGTILFPIKLLISIWVKINKNIDV